MPEEQIRQLEARVKYLEAIILDVFLSDRISIARIIQMQDGKNIQLATGTGTKIGTATGQKLGFYNVTPVIQPATVADPTTQGATYVQADVNSIVTAVNTVIDRLQELGLIQ